MEEVKTNQSISVGDWMLTILIAAIPLVGFIMLFVWAFGGNAPESKANWAKASLIWLVIVIALYSILFMAFGLALWSSDEFAYLMK